ncbi:unnamed protein product [Parnassius apollo]|uniref:(apollo) hypothetical protein n=1 Tax=Parnassius apollo TaxID=110799 RepID=A0A8S3WJ47_PARAO|nr:unnamed protein product [Parnassius apollo]
MDNSKLYRINLTDNVISKKSTHKTYVTIVAAMQAEEASSRDENLCLDEELRSSTAAAPLIKSHKELVGVNNVHPENEMMPGDIYEWYCSGTSSSTSTSSSSSSSTSSGKAFSTDEADN